MKITVTMDDAKPYRVYLRGMTGDTWQAARDDRLVATFATREEAWEFLDEKAQRFGSMALRVDKRYSPDHTYWGFTCYDIYTRSGFMFYLTKGQVSIARATDAPRQVISDEQ
jgi:hypothetical protein